MISDSEGMFREITDALVPITCCKVDNTNTNYPKKIEYKNVTACLTEPSDDSFTNHDVSMYDDVTAHLTMLSF